MLTTALVVLCASAACHALTLILKKQDGIGRLVDVLFLIPTLIGAYAVWTVL